MKRFYVKGTAFTSDGIIVFQERNLKKAIKKINLLDNVYIIFHQKDIRKGKGNYWYKLAITKLDENKIEADNIKAGKLYE